MCLNYDYANRTEETYHYENVSIFHHRTENVMDLCITFGPKAIHYTNSIC